MSLMQSYVINPPPKMNCYTFFVEQMPAVPSEEAGMLPVVSLMESNLIVKMIISLQARNL